MKWLRQSGRYQLELRASQMSSRLTQSRQFLYPHKKRLHTDLLAGNNFLMEGRCEPSPGYQKSFTFDLILRAYQMFSAPIIQAVGHVATDFATEIQEGMSLN